MVLENTMGESAAANYFEYPQPSWRMFISTWCEYLVHRPFGVIGERPLRGKQFGRTNFSK